MDKLTNACNGKSASKGGLNLPEMRQMLLNRYTDHREEINRLSRKDLEVLCQQLLKSGHKVYSMTGGGQYTALYQAVIDLFDAMDQTNHVNLKSKKLAAAKEVVKLLEDSYNTKFIDLTEQDYLRVVSTLVHIFRMKGAVVYFDNERLLAKDILYLIQSGSTGVEQIDNITHDTDLYRPDWSE